MVEHHASAAVLVAKLRTEGVLRSERIEQAMLNVPRHVFANWLDHDEAYSDTAHVIPGTTAEAPATISQPHTIVQVLETAQPFPGARILEVGTGTGYFAALMAHLVGPQGSVVTIDIETTLVALARQHLDTARVRNVVVHHGDGADGYAADAPYDLIVSSVGLWEIPWRWVSQLKPRGAIVAPLHLAGGAHDHVLVHLERVGRVLVGRGVASLAMVVVRGRGAPPSVEELTRTGARWNGAAVDQLLIWIRPKSLPIDVKPNQKLFEKQESYVILERAVQ